MARVKSKVKSSYHKYVAGRYALKAGKYASVVTPYAVEFGIHFDEWFIQNENGWQLGMGFSIAMTVMAVAMWLRTKKDEDEKLIDSNVTLIVGWFAMAGVFALLANIMNQIAMIMVYGGLGMIVSAGFGKAESSLNETALVYKEAIRKAKLDNQLDADELANQAYQEALEAKKAKKKAIKGRV